MTDIKVTKRIGNGGWNGPIAAKNGNLWLARSGRGHTRMKVYDRCDSAV